MNAYRVLLRLVPRRLRDKHGREMEAVFRHRVAEARQRGRVAMIVTWIIGALDIFSSIPIEISNRRRRRGRVGLPVERRPHMFGSDFRYAWRALAHQKLGSSLIVSMLALGIAANVAVFSLINGLFLRPLPFPNAERLVYLNETAPKWNLETTGITYADFAQWHHDFLESEASAPGNEHWCRLREAVQAQVVLPFERTVGTPLFDPRSLTLAPELAIQSG